MAPQLSIVVVTYNSGALLGGCLESLFADPLIGECEVLLVDNASTDGCAEAAALQFPAVEVVLMGRNAGFGAANNAGIARSSAPLVLLANPDTRLAEGGLAALVEFMRTHAAAGLLGPKLLNADRTLQSSIRNFPSVAREGIESVYLHRLVPALAHHFSHVVEEPKAYEREQAVDWVSGAVMLGRTDALREIGGFDEGFFLYSEEIDLSRRLQESSWEVWYSPCASFLHIGGEYTENTALGLEDQRSRLRYFLKHEGRAAMLLVAGLTVVRLLVRSIAWLIPAALGRDRSWRNRLRTSLYVLARYPALVASFLFSPEPTTVSTLAEGT